ncbi:hypothetical protein EYR40_001379 [Pleurotus pulmonarius]|nr:hypothetical protein EYR36_000280 [Pleurotus pulmonarius]KAF4604196.1 hypothetical protein EYR38_004618 [Pleurotus pulmonarius]KAF4609026.1 hypothetical protein EYR40_001379 [Pleurotus pulmonarius]
MIMSSAGCSSSTSLLEKDSLLRELPASGTYKVKYNPDQDWDFHLDTAQSPVDVELVLPHYRARNQPVDHRMSMMVSNDAGSLKVKVCRPSHRSKFYLEVQSESSDVTVWLPSDFRGQIHHSGRAKYSAGFVNRILQNVRLNEGVYDDVMEEDEVVVYTHGTIAFRMWDTQTRAPENSRKENLKRLFGCGRKAPETAIDWDFLLD